MKLRLHNVSDTVPGTQMWTRQTWSFLPIPLNGGIQTNKQVLSIVRAVIREAQRATKAQRSGTSRRLPGGWKRVGQMKKPLGIFAFWKPTILFPPNAEHVYGYLMNACCIFKDKRVYLWFTPCASHPLTWGCTSWGSGSPIFDDSSWRKYCHLSPLWPWVDETESGASFAGLDALMLLNGSKRWKE